MKRLFLISLFALGVQTMSACIVANPYGYVRPNLYMSAEGGWHSQVVNNDTATMRTNPVVGSISVGVSFEYGATIGANFTTDGLCNQIGLIGEFRPLRDKFDVPIRVRVYYDMQRKGVGAGLSAGFMYHLNEKIALVVRDEVCINKGINVYNNLNGGIIIYL